MLGELISELQLNIYWETLSFSFVVTAALQHAGKHMEDSIVASYTALLLGCLCQGSQVKTGADLYILFCQIFKKNL